MPCFQFHNPSSQHQTPLNSFVPGSVLLLSVRLKEEPQKPFYSALKWKRFGPLIVAMVDDVESSFVKEVSVLVCSPLL